MNFNKIKFHAKEKNIPIKRIYDELGLSAQGFDYIIKNESITIKQLEVISRTMRTKMAYWFEDEQEAQPMRANEEDASYGQLSELQLMAKLVAQNEILIRQNEELLKKKITCNTNLTQN